MPGNWAMLLFCPCVSWLTGSWRQEGGRHFSPAYQILAWSRTDDEVQHHHPIHCHPTSNPKWNLIFQLQKCLYIFFTRENKYNSICWQSHGKSAIGQRKKNNTHNLWPIKRLTFWAVMSGKSDAGLYVNWQLSLLPCDFIDTLRMESFLGAHVAVLVGFIV